MTHQSEGISSAGCSLLIDEDFSCSLDVLYGGLGISELHFFIIKNVTCNFLKLIFGHQNPRSGSALPENPGSGPALKAMQILWFFAFSLM